MCTMEATTGKFRPQLHMECYLDEQLSLNQITSVRAIDVELNASVI